MQQKEGREKGKGASVGLGALSCLGACETAHASHFVARSVERRGVKRTPSGGDKRLLDMYVEYQRCNRMRTLFSALTNLAVNLLQRERHELPVLDNGPSQLQVTVQRRRLIRPDKQAKTTKQGRGSQYSFTKGRHPEHKWGAVGLPILPCLTHVYEREQGRMAAVVLMSTTYSVETY